MNCVHNIFIFCMNNPEFLQNDLNFSNLFKKMRIHPAQPKQQYSMNRSTFVSPRQNLGHRTPKFIPKYPYGRSSSVNSPRKPDLQQFSPQIGVFSVRTFDTKHLMSTSFSSQIKTKKQNYKQIRQNLNNPKLFKPDKFELLKFGSDSVQQYEDKKIKVRGLKVRTGSEVKKEKIVLELDPNVIVTGTKISKTNK